MGWVGAWLAGHTLAGMLRAPGICRWENATVEERSANGKPDVT